jgi:hypothetical protein
VKILQVGSPKAWTNSPRKHSPKQIRKIADSIIEFGWATPILIIATTEKFFANVNIPTGFI